MKGFYKNPLYQIFPVWGQNLYVTIKATVYNIVRRNRSSLKCLKEIHYNETLSKEQLEVLQLSRLRTLVRSAARTIPWYSQIFKKVGFDPNSPFTFKEYEQLPLLDKDTIRNNVSLFVPKTIKSLLSIKSQSSGTTGNSLFVTRGRGVIGSEWAFSKRQYRWASVSQKARVAYLRDDQIVPPDTFKPPYWRYGWCNNELWLSSFHLNSNTVQSYIEELQRYRPECIYAYPSTIYWLAVFAQLLQIDAEIPSLKGIIVSSEMLYEFQSEVIKKVFNVPVYDWYGSVERVIFVGTCEKGTKHLFPDYGYTEFLPSSNNEELFEMIGTGFINTLMPLLRYKSGDIVSLSEHQCACGRHFSVIQKIYGRTNDAILTPDGRRVSVVEIFDKITTISQLQIIQQTRDSLDINVVPKPDFSQKDRNEITKNLRILVGNEMLLHFKTVERIPGGPDGKYRMIISKLNEQSANRVESKKSVIQEIN